MKVLAIDHGNARCGFAISDATGTIVRPLRTLPPEIDAIAELIGEERAEAVVVGLPLSMDGTEGEQAAIVREFCAELTAAVSVSVETYDERLTTALAGASRRAGAGAEEDSLAAAHLLESYLASQESSAPRTVPGDMA